MPRCCVPGCDTGTRAEIVRTRKAKARNKSTFLLPSNYPLFRKWEKMLGLKYDTPDGRSGRVCELHFDESDIIRHYYKQMPDGRIQQFTFSRPTLRKEVIPLSIPREEYFQPRYEKKIRINKQKKVSEDLNDKENIPKKRGRKRKCSLENYDENLNVCNKKSCLGFNNANIPYSRKRKNSSDEDESYVPYKKPKKNNASKNYEKRKYTRKIKTPRNKLISSSVGISSKPNYTFDKLVHNLNRRNSKLPKGWEYSFIDDDTFKLVYTQESLKYCLTCTVKRDTSLEIQAYNTNVIKNVEFKFLSHAHFHESLKELQKIDCCKGIIYKKFTKKCKGFIPVNKTHQGSKNSDRCKVCKKQWDNIIRKPRLPRFYVRRLYSLTHRKKFGTKIMKIIKTKIKAGRKF